MSKRPRDDGGKSRPFSKKPRLQTKRSNVRASGAVTGEMKYFDTNLLASALTASTDWTATEHDPATFNTLFAPVVGAAINQRVGKACSVHKIRINGAVQSTSQIDQTAGDPGSQVRVMLVQDMQTNAAQMQGEQLMSTQANALGSNLAFQNIDNFGRFKVLREKFITLQNPNFTWDGTNLEQQGLIQRFKMNFVFNSPVKVRFNGTNGGTVADIVDNSFHIIAQASNIGLTPLMTYVSRVAYKD